MWRSRRKGAHRVSAACASGGSLTQTDSPEPNAPRRPYLAWPWFVAGEPLKRFESAVGQPKDGPSAMPKPFEVGVHVVAKTASLSQRISDGGGGRRCVSDDFERGVEADACHLPAACATRAELVSQFVVSGLITRHQCLDDRPFQRAPSPHLTCGNSRRFRFCVGPRGLPGAPTAQFVESGHFGGSPAPLRLPEAVAQSRRPPRGRNPTSSEAFSRLSTNV
jgi:hypothetical protein